MTNYRKYYKFLAPVILLIAFLIALRWNFFEDKAELTALIDVALTTIALTIAILEILMLRSIADSSKEAVENALDRITEIISVSDITKGVKTAYDIQKYLRSKEFVIAHIRMQDLKFIVIPLRNDQRFEMLASAKKLPEIFTTLAIDINNVDSVNIGKKNMALDIPKINGNLEELVTVLIEYENHIRSSKTKTE